MSSRMCIRTKSVSLLILAAVSVASANDDDFAGRGVARLSLLNGDVSIQRGDSGDHVSAALNAPLVVEDRVFTGANSRAEVQLDYANFVRLSSNTEVRLTELVSRRYQIQLAAGMITLSVLRDSDADVEIATPSIALRPLKRGSYRIFVTPEGETEALVRSGELEVFTPTGAQRLRSGQMMRVRGDVSNPEYQIAKAYSRDDWDRWNRNRDEDLERATGYRYVSRDIYGIEDLDSWGSWVSVSPYGMVWTPRVAVGWAPYRFGRWAWIDFYGWSWISYDPWGWAPFHYGRWFWNSGRWCWYPGGLRVRHHWSPALVAFVGWDRGIHPGSRFGRIGWIPLGPHDPFHRWWGRGIYRGYRDGRYADRDINVINNINIRNTYHNSRVANAITGLDAGDFTRGRPGTALRMGETEIHRASVVRGVVPITPERESLRMADRSVPAPVRVSREERGFYSRRQAEPVERIPFEQQRAGLERISRGGGEAATSEPSGRLSPGASGFGRAVSNDAVVNTPAAERATGWRSLDSPGGRSGERGISAGDRQPETGWRRFGEPASRESHGAGENRESSSSRRSFGEPGNRGQVADPSPSPDRNGSDWRGFGNSGVTDRTLAPNSDSRSGDWRRFESSGSGYGRSSRGAADSGDSTPRQERRSVDVSPPVVRERSSGWGGFERRSGGDNNQVSRPSRDSSGFGGGRGGERAAPSSGRSGGSSGSGSGFGGGSRSSGGSSRGSGGGGGRGRDR